MCKNIGPPNYTIQKNKLKKDKRLKYKSQNHNNHRRKNRELNLKYST